MSPSRRDVKLGDGYPPQRSHEGRVMISDNDAGTSFLTTSMKIIRLTFALPVSYTDSVFSMKSRQRREQLSLVQDVYDH